MLTIYDINDITHKTISRKAQWKICNQSHQC